MKTIPKRHLALAACLATWCLHAQEEQWLEYHKSSEPRAYRWMELSPTPPPNVALPTLRSSPLYGCWTNGFDGPRWFCLDRASRSGPCDRVFVDSNGNGRLDDETPAIAIRRESNMAFFDPVKILFKGEDGPVGYHLVLRFYQFDSNRAQLLVGSGGWYEGTVTLAGKKRQIQVRDNTVNGTFNDIGDNPTECDQIVLPGARSVTRYLGRYLEVDDQLLEIEIARDGAFIKATRAEGVAMASLRVPQSITTFEAVGRNGHFARTPGQGALTIPAGKYRVHGWTSDRKDSRGDTWTLKGYGFSTNADFELVSGIPTPLELGEPVRAVLQATESRTSVSFNLKLLGSLNESVEILKGSERGPAPRLVIASQTGSFRSTNSFEYG